MLISSRFTCFLISVLLISNAIAENHRYRLEFDARFFSELYGDEGLLLSGRPIIINIYKTDDEQPIGYLALSGNAFPVNLKSFLSLRDRQWKLVFNPPAPEGFSEAMAQRLLRYLEAGFQKPERYLGRTSVDFIMKHLDGVVVDLEQLDTPYTLQFFEAKVSDDELTHVTLTDNHGNVFFYEIPSGSGVLPDSENIQPRRRPRRSIDWVADRFLQQVLKECSGSSLHCIQNAIDSDTRKRLVKKRKIHTANPATPSSTPEAGYDRILSIHTATYIVAGIGVFYTAVAAAAAVAICWVCSESNDKKNQKIAEKNAAATKSMNGDIPDSKGGGLRYQPTVGIDQIAGNNAGIGGEISLQLEVIHSPTTDCLEESPSSSDSGVLVEETNIDNSDGDITDYAQIEKLLQSIEMEVLDLQKKVGNHADSSRQLP